MLGEFRGGRIWGNGLLTYSDGSTNSEGYFQESNFRSEHRNHCMASSSVVDPNTLNLDPDPECWPILDPDSDLGLLSIEKEFFFLRTTIFFKIIFFNYKKVMATEEKFSQLSL